MAQILPRPACSHILAAACEGWGHADWMVGPNVWVVWQRGTTEVRQVETDPIGRLLPCLEGIWGEWCLCVASESIDRFR